MLEIEITRLIFAAVASILLGYACYVAAFVKHRNEIRDGENKRLLNLKDSGLSPQTDLTEQYRIEKTSTWYLGYRLALLGLIVIATAVGWAVSWAVGQDYVLTWVEDGVLAASAAIIGGLVLDKHIIHPIADGSFFEKVEDPIVQRFLQDGGSVIAVKEKKGFFAKRKQRKDVEKIAEAVADTRPVIVTPENANVTDISHLTFDEKIRLLEILKKSL